MAIEKITGIVTDTLKHSDRHNVVILFTRSHGRLALLAPAGNGKTARLRNAALMPLSVISADININPSRELNFLGRFQRHSLWKDLYFNHTKSAIAMFLSEFINNYIRNSGVDARLWDYIYDSITVLERSDAGLANFHLAFLLEYMTYAGIRPDISEWRPDSWFDMRGGTMTIFPPTHRDFITPEDARILPTLMRLNTHTFKIFRLSAAQRRDLLKGILRYYSLHFPGLDNLKSPQILSEIFS